MSCPRGHQNAPGAVFCIRCGAPLAAYPGPPPVHPAPPPPPGVVTPPSQRRTAIGAIAGVAVLGLAIGSAAVVIALQNGKDDAAAHGDGSASAAASAAVSQCQSVLSTYLGDLKDLEETWSGPDTGIGTLRDELSTIREAEPTGMVPGGSCLQIKSMADDALDLYNQVESDWSSCLADHSNDAATCNTEDGPVDFSPADDAGTEVISAYDALIHGTTPGGLPSLGMNGPGLPPYNGSVPSSGGGWDSGTTT